MNLSRSSSIVLCSVLIAQLVTCSSARASVNFSAGDSGQGTMSGNVSVAGVGKASGNGSANFEDDRVSIILGSDLTTKIPSLTGTTFKTRKKNDRLTGFVFFNGGSQISKLDDSQSTETVKITDGTTITGHITDCSHGQMKIDTDGGTRTIDTNQIDTVKSPRVFRFDTTLTADLISFTCTATGTITGVKEAKTAKTSSSSSSSDKHKTTKRVIVAVCVLVLIAVAIAVPVALTHHHHNSSQPFEFSRAPAPVPAQAAAVAP